jgi:peroxiredoxin|tara:strand:+ start:147 stop:566 length:420 start_codon:yes stop_codon:yes gene_type:complete
MDTTGLFILKDKNIVPYEIKEKKVILCGVPGAFTPGCTNRHLPGFVDNLGKLKEKGIEKVIFMAVNDAFVMDEWNKLYGDKQIDAVSDPIAEFTTRMNEKVDWGKQFGVRCNRFAYLIEDGQIVKKFDDPFIEGVMKEL